MRYKELTQKKVEQAINILTAVEAMVSGTPTREEIREKARIAKAILEEVTSLLSKENQQ